MTDQNSRASVVVTGVSGCLGSRLLPHLSAYSVTGIDIKVPDTLRPLRFVQMDLGLEDSCRELFLLMRELRPTAVIHLAFSPGPVIPGSSQADRAWQVNVAGTARVFEALTEVNRDAEIIKKFIFLSHSSVYGPDLSQPVTEDQKLAAHSYHVAVHKMEADQAIQRRAAAARGCSVFILRAANFAGPHVSNFLLEALGGTPDPGSKWGARLAKKGKRLPLVAPWGNKYMQNEVQFVHVDDVARLITFILRKSEPESRHLTVLNVSGRGQPMSRRDTYDLSHTRVIRLPGERTVGVWLRGQKAMGLSQVVEESAKYLSGNSVMVTDRLHDFLGPNFEDVIQYQVCEALASSFNQTAGSDSLNPESLTDA